MNEETLSSESLDRLGLLQQPFAVTMGEQFLFVDPGIDMGVNVVLQHLRGPQNLVVLRGETGSGKSTQLLRILASGEADLDFCAFRARTDTTLAAIETAVSSFWQEKLAAAQADELASGSLGLQLTQLMQDGLKPVLAIDDADRLPADVIAELLDIRQQILQRFSNSFGLLLVGSPRIEERLNSICDDSDMLLAPMIIQQRPLNSEQTRAYLTHRLRAAGLRDMDLLDDAAMQDIHRRSGGLPGQINQLASQTLRAIADSMAGDQLGSSLGIKKLAFGGMPAQPLRTWLGAAASVVVLGGGALLIGLATRPSVPVEDPLSRPLVLPERPAEVTVQPEAAPEVSAEPSMAPVEPATAETRETAPAPEAPTAPPPSAAATPPMAETTGVLGADWLRQQDPSQFTLQFISGSDAEALRAYAQRVDLPGEVAMFSVRRNDQVSYALVYGVYPSAAAARSAIVALPAAVRRNQPFARSFASINEAMAD